MLFYEIEVLGIPKFIFAYNVEAEKLTNYFNNKPDFLEICIIEEGQTIAESLDKKIRTISRPHTISMITSNMAATTRSYGSERHRHSTVGVRVKYNLKLYNSEEHYDLKELKERVQNGSTALIPFRHDPGESFDMFLNSIKKVITLNSSESPHDRLNAVSAWFSFLGLLTEYTLKKLDSAQDEFTPSELNYVAKATKYINNNYMNKLTVDEIAEKLGISIGYLHRIFKKSKGISILEYINSRRISIAIDLMENKNLSLKDAAYNVGIDDPAYMSRLFKKTTGQSFREYFREKRFTPK